jgi:hypothetical protein
VFPGPRALKMTRLLSVDHSGNTGL